MNSMIFSILLIIVGLGIGLIIAFAYNTFKEKNQESKSNNIIDQAKKEADKIKREAILEQKEEIHKLKMTADKEIKEKKAELKDSEQRLIQRENNMDKRDELYQKRESSLDEREEKLADRLNEIQNKNSEVEEIKKQQLELLQKISGFSKEKAKDLIMDRVKEDMSKEISIYIREQENEAKLTADRKAKELIVSSMQKYAADIACEQTVTVVDLPNDEMKGRIIGREGRNIRTIEAITGVDLIIDDTPETVVLSSFDPTRIEELYDKTCKEMKQKIIEFGNDALFEIGISKVDPALVEIIGKLHFRTSYGQNALRHSVEVAELSGLLAAEVGEDVQLAKRAGLLHDIGKAIDHEIEGSHVDIGVDLATKYHENDVVINAIASHHGDVKATSVISSIVAIADAISASRPGARNDSLENYIKRLRQLEEVASDIDGVDKTFAVQAGREIRVIVKPEEIDDLGAHKIARDVKEKIEENMKYPGTIKVTVIRETRAQEEAK